MKSQLQRILNSDLSEYKIAVTDHINNINHFQQCLSQRSAFMQNFNQMLQRQLQRISKQPPTQFDAIQLDNPTSTYRCSQALSQITYKTTNQQQNQPQKQKHKQSTKYQTTLNKTIKLFTQNIKTLQLQYKNIRKYINQQIKQTKVNIFQNVKNSICMLLKQKEENSIKIQQLQQIIQRLRQQNVKLNTQLQHKSHLNLNNYLTEGNQKISISANFQNMQNSLNKNVQKIAQPILLQQYQSPINNLTTINHISQIHEIKNSIFLQKSDILPKQLKQQKQHKQPNREQNNILQNNLLKNNYPTSYYQSQNQPQPMKIQNINQINWKHYVCDLQFTTMKQIKVKPNSYNTSKIIGGEYAGSDYQYKNHNKQNQKIQAQPYLPALLRKNGNDRCYDIPAVRSLIVSYPPVDEGFAIFKLGNDVVYKGMWKYKKFHGKGKLTLPEYEYEGDFLYGLFHGRGVLKVGKLQYIGLFSQNKADGQGVLKIGSKNISGRWRNNILQQKF